MATAGIIADDPIGSRTFLRRGQTKQTETFGGYLFGVVPETTAYHLHRIAGAALCWQILAAQRWWP